MAASKKKASEKTMGFIDWDGIQAKLQDKYPLGIPRPKTGEVSGGLIHPRTMANKDCLGEGIEDRYKVGKTVIYPVAAFLDFWKDMVRDA